MTTAKQEQQAVRRATYAALALRRFIARDVIALGKRISRAPLTEGQIDNVLKLHGLWCDLGRVEELLQVLTGTPPEEAGVWPSRLPSDPPSEEREQPPQQRPKRARRAAPAAGEPAGA